MLPRCFRRHVLLTLFLLACFLPSWFLSQGLAKQDKKRDRQYISKSSQRTGDPQQGWRYLIYGNYLTSGVPLEMFQRTHPQPPANQLKREGPSANVPYEYNVVTSSTGNPIVTPNCLQCHAQELDGQFIMGLGNTLGNFTQNYAVIAQLSDSVLAAHYGTDSPQRQDFEQFKNTMIAVGPYIQTRVRGVNPADKLAFMLSLHRDPATLQWNDDAQFDRELAKVTVPTDVPPWWILAKKNALFYNAAGRGDFARIMMASSLVTLKDAQEAKVIDKAFVDVLAWIKTIEPPVYPQPIDQALASKGRAIFENNCASCHGRYGKKETYPNLVINLDRVGTDPLLAQSSKVDHRASVEAYNQSWFAQPPHAARLEPSLGYIAPPLDGIWATAPYLHNGSVPDLASLLESSKRPTLWRRSFDTSDYDYQTVGWRYQTPTQVTDIETYDTTQPGYGNQGHTFGDELKTNERRAVIEYLKSL